VNAKEFREHADRLNDHSYSLNTSLLDETIAMLRAHAATLDNRTGGEAPVVEVSCRPMDEPRFEALRAVDRLPFGTHKLYTHPAPKADADADADAAACAGDLIFSNGPGDVVVTMDDTWHAVAVTRQNEDGKILSVIWEYVAASPARVGEDRDYGKVWHDHYYQAFMRWLEDDSTHWINDKDAAWQAWMYLHEYGLTTYPEAAMSRETQ
jgi:hypothetical protein